jgi:predicted GNAT family acetyltransferase
MTALPEKLFANPVWHALQTRHRHLAVSAGNASRYPADVTPFVAVAEPSVGALRELHSLLVPEDRVWIIGESFPATPGLVFGRTMEVLQMVLPEEVTPPDSTIEILPLTDANAGEMVALTTLAFPGFFRIRTCEMGSYYGVRSEAELIAMSGERLMLDGYSEVSGVCTHPAHRGKGYASGLMWEVVRKHRRDGDVSWLHVAAANQHAIEMYLRMGFTLARSVMLHRVSREK